MAAQLQHVHLPRLVAAGVVEYDAIRTNAKSPNRPSDQSPATTGYAPPNANTPTTRLTVAADPGDPRTAFPSETKG